MPYTAPLDSTLETHPKWGRVFKYIFSNGSSKLTIYKINTMRNSSINKTFIDQDSNTGVIVGKVFYYVFPWDLCISSNNRDQTLSFDNIVHTVSFGHGNNTTDLISLNPFTPPNGIETINFCGPYGSTVTASTSSCVLQNKLFGFWEYNQGKPRCGLYSRPGPTPLDIWPKNRVNNNKFNLQKLISGTSKYSHKVMNINITKLYNSSNYDDLIHISQCYKNILFAFPRDRVFHSVTMKDMLFELVNIYTPNSITILSCRPSSNYINPDDTEGSYKWSASINNVGPSIAERYKALMPQAIARGLPTTSSDVTIKYT